MKKTKDDKVIIKKTLVDYRIDEMKGFLINQIDQDKKAIAILKLSMHDKQVQLNIINKYWKN